MTGLYLPVLPEKSIDEDFMITMQDQMVPRATVRKSGKVLEVDVESAWDELALKASWNNEVTVEVYMSWEK